MQCVCSLIICDCVRGGSRIYKRREGGLTEGTNLLGRGVCMLELGDLGACPPGNF